MLQLIFIFVATTLLAQSRSDLLLYRQTREGVDRVLAECVAKGVTSIDVAILPAGEAKPNVYGEFAMGYGGQEHMDVTLPNPKFFQHLDWVLKRAAEKRIELRLLPVDPRSILVTKNSSEKWFEWGRYLGRRYVKAKNLIWLRLSESSAGSLLSVEEGIRQFDSTHRFELAKPL